MKPTEVRLTMTADLSLETAKRSRTAVYAAVFNHDYERIQLRDPLNVPFYHMTEAGHALLSNRLSYFFDLKDPSVTINTDCSSNMMALHLTCQSMRSEEVDQALVRAAYLILNPAMMTPMSTLRKVKSAS